MINNIYAAVITLICTCLSSILTFFLTKRKYNTEVDSQQIKNMSESFDVYKKMMESNLQAQRETFETVLKSLNQKVDALQSENDSLRQQVSQLQTEMINFLGNICLDFTCKHRKVSMAPELKSKTKQTNTEDK